MSARTTENALLEKIDALILALQAPKVPATRELWTAEMCAAYLKVTKSKFTRDISQPGKGFPRARNVGDTINATNYRWVASDVMAWALAQSITTKH